MVSPARRPAAVAFDVVETLFSLEPVRQRLEAAGSGPRGLEVFFARMLRDAFALVASGGYRPFPELAAAALAATLPDADDDTRSHVLAGFSELPAHPDAGPAMERLTAAGVGILCLTNGGTAATTGLLERNGLDGYVERVVSVDEVRAWKPVPAPYHHAAAMAGVEPGELALVAVHAWDCHGAHRAGLLTGWASRLEGRFAPTFDPPDVAGADLVEVVDGLLALEK
jgi:2-haloacid dehalogenase